MHYYRPKKRDAACTVYTTSFTMALCTLAWVWWLYYCVTKRLAAWATTVRDGSGRWRAGLRLGNHTALGNIYTGIRTYTEQGGYNSRSHLEAIAWRTPFSWQTTFFLKIDLHLNDCVWTSERITWFCAITFWLHVWSLKILYVLHKEIIVLYVISQELVCIQDSEEELL